MAEAIVITAAALVGYILGRTRPLRRAQRAIDWRLIAPDPARPLGWLVALNSHAERSHVTHRFDHRHRAVVLPQSGGGEQRG